MDYSSTLLTIMHTGVSAGGACSEGRGREQSAVPALLCAVPGRRKAQRVSRSPHAHCAVQASAACLLMQCGLQRCIHQHTSETSICCNREERIEKSGPLGKADVANRELDGVEKQLRAAVTGDQPDGLCMYLLGVICAERCACSLHVMQDHVRCQEGWPSQMSYTLQQKMWHCLQGSEGKRNACVIRVPAGVPMQLGSLAGAACYERSDAHQQSHHQPLMDSSKRSSS